MLNYQSHITISSWNIRGLGDKHTEELFLKKITADINIILETWKGENYNTQIEGFVSITKCRKKHKKSKRHSGGIIIYVKKSIFKGVSYLCKETTSPNRAWLKLDKQFFGLEKDLYLCAIYIPPQNSVHANDDLIDLENEISKLSCLGEISLIGDFNARIGSSDDFISDEGGKSEIFQDFLPVDYDNDVKISRNNLDKVINQQGQNLLNLCISSRLRILNGRYLGDSLGYHTCYTVNGCSTVDYAIVSRNLLSSVKFFCTTDLNYLSDHVQIYFVLSCKRYCKNNIYKKEISHFQKCQTYKWTDQSRNKMVEILNTEELKNKIVNFEVENFENNAEGVNFATKRLSEIFESISDRVCKIKTPVNNKRKYKPKKPWSDNELRNLKSKINYIGKQLKNKPFDKTLRNNYFCTAKELKRLAKRKKYEYQQNFVKDLFNCSTDNPQKFWKLLKSNKGNHNLNKLELDSDLLRDHFQTQGNFKSTNIDFERQIEKIIEDSGVYAENEVTDKPISISEVNKVISSIKTGKASGPDLILNEIIKYSSIVTVKSVTKLFNLILETGFYPDSWNKAFIIPVFKSGDFQDPNNYRGISLLNGLSKIFSAVLNNRIMTHMYDKFSQVQFGFRPNHRTTDSIFIFKTLMNKYLSLNKKPIYVCFVDLRKAFDSVWRKALFYKLLSCGIGKKMVNIIKEMYSNSKSAVKIDGHFYSEYFNIDRGVRQGDSLSPTLFNIYINEISELFVQNSSSPLILESTKIGSLLFADDLLLLSETKEGLQNSLNKLSDYCDKWQLTVNCKKTKTMILSSGKTKETALFKYKGEIIESVNEFKFLGNCISKNGNLISSAKQLAQKALKVMYSIRSYTSNITQMPANLACHLFDSLVRPILTFNSEIWYMDIYRSYHNSDCRAKQNKIKTDYFHFIDRSIVDGVHTKFCKFTLGVKKYASNLAARAELGRYPIDCFIKTQSLLYEERLFNRETNPLLKECYNVSKMLHLNGIYSWYTYINHIRDELNVKKSNNCENIHTKSSNRISKIYFKKETSDHFYKQYQERILNLDQNSKLQIFKAIKTDYTFEKYLYCLNPEIRRLICKFRISDHILEIESGRYKKIPRNLRLCNSCMKIEDEIHFFLDCSINKSIRTQFLSNFVFENNATPIEKLKKILNPDTEKQVRLLGSFLKQSIALRTGGR